MFDQVEENLELEEHDCLRRGAFEHVRDSGHDAAFQRRAPVESSFAKIVVLLPAALRQHRQLAHLGLIICSSFISFSKLI